MIKPPDQDALLEWLNERNAGELEFLQAAGEIVHDVWPLVEDSDRFRRSRILERLLEPDRIVSFRVSWEDDDGELQINRGYRVQTSNALGPYKGGLRFHPSVNASILKFLALEQSIKSSLTNLSIGSGKGGSDFDPKGKSDSEIRRFCQAFMENLGRHIGPETDVPAGDIGVGAREIGYLFGQFKRMSGAFEGALTGKPVTFGGSELRTEATGFGVVYFAGLVLEHADQSLEGRRCAVSGAGNVATYCARKLIDKGATVTTLSDSGGTLVAKDGVDDDLLCRLATGDYDLADLAQRFDLEYREGEKPWTQPCDLAFPCATQNEIDEHDAQTLIEGGCRWVVEGANMPCTHDALTRFRDRGIVVCPGKAANAGGVVVSALEMSQNAMFRRWSKGRVDEELQATMREIHAQCVDHLDDGSTDYVKAANRAGFLRLAEAMVAQGA